MPIFVAENCAVLKLSGMLCVPMDRWTDGKTCDYLILTRKYVVLVVVLQLLYFMSTDHQCFYRTKPSPLVLHGDFTKLLIPGYSMMIEAKQIHHS